MKKLLIVGFTKLSYMPYLNFYLEALGDAQTEIHVVSWRRDSEKDIKYRNSRIILHEFVRDQEDQIAKIKKVSNFIRYRSFVISLLNKMRFDKVIVLHTLPAVLIADKLLRRYCGRFILDYRDYTYEDLGAFKSVIGKLVKASYATFVSSDAFRDALPKLDKVYTSHNLLVDSLAHRDAHPARLQSRLPIRVAFWGFIRHEKINEELIRKLGEDTRFELHYYGREQQTAWNLKALVEKKQFSNIFFHGTYLPEERYAFAAQTDLIHNIYENDAGMQKAMSNKYYDGIIFQIPQLCTAGSYMGERAEKDGVGCALDPFADEFVDQLVRYYQEYDRSQFEANCDRACERVVSEFKKGQDIIREFAECK